MPLLLILDLVFEKQVYFSKAPLNIFFYSEYYLGTCHYSQPSEVGQVYAYEYTNALTSLCFTLNELINF